ncbi:MAG TPA: MerR family transcriptional regulator [Polyangiaceae bacterium]|jgi:methanogenic corrinoid protein MtbC1|nr:MerR family transcriptional regulator [Polyangiaceae bacterium]
MAEREDAATPDAPQGYSIRVASRLTGVSSDTLRMWERRYGFPKPVRNGAQVRVYTDSDVERLVLISRALKAGFRAGEVIHRTAVDLRALLVNSARTDADNDRRTPTVDSLLGRLVDDDPDGLHDELRRSVALLGPKQFLTDVAAPLIDSVGEAWAAGRIAVRHEHLVSEVLSSKLRLLLSAYDDRAGGPTVLLATLSDEQHGLGLEMVALYLALEGARPRLLGVNTPPDQIAAAAAALSARVIGLSISEASEIPVTETQLRRLLSALPSGTELWVGGKQARKLGLRDARLHQVVTWLELERAVTRLHS